MPREYEEELWTLVFSLVFGFFLLVPPGHPPALVEPKCVKLKAEVNLSNAEGKALVCLTKNMPLTQGTICKST